MIFRRSTPAEDRPLAAGVFVLRGDMACRAPGTVEGRIEGMIRSSASLAILQGGDIRGNVRAETLTIHGRVQGGVICRGSATLAAGCEVRGPLQAAALEIGEGADYEGMLTVRPTEP